MLSARTISPKTCLVWVLALTLNASAQEPERKPEAPPAQKTASPTPEKNAPAAVQKAEPQKPEPQKAEPQRKGGIQNAEATKTESEKGSTANLGTDVAAVRQRIEAALNSDPSLKGTVFNLNVTDDTIEITGIANSGRDRTAARRIVQSFAGNLRVKDRITVAGAAPPPSAVPNSTESDKPKQQADAEADALAKPESDETPQKKANKPKKDPAKHGDQSPEPRR